MAVLQDLSQAELIAQIEALKAQNEKLRKANTGKLTAKVSEKGGVSVYGLGRFPVTLYREQWERLFAAKDDIMAFIEANADRLSVKE